MKEELSSEKMAEETKEAVDVSQWLALIDSNEEGASLMTLFNDLNTFNISVYDESTQQELSSEKMGEERDDGIVILTGSDELARTAETGSLEERVHIFHSVGTPFMTSESTGQVVKLTNQQTTVRMASHQYQEGLFATSDECAVLLGGCRRSKNDPVQVPEELERMNSMEATAFPAEGTSFMQMRIPLVIPIINALITQDALTCSNCDERVVAKQTLCYPDWCGKCNEALWSTREIHS